MHLLVAEDDRRLAPLLNEGLTARGYLVDVASDGVQALALALDADFDLLILDVMMPGLDGLAVVRELRRRQIATPVLLLTARAEVADRVLGLDAGADDYLTKPFAFEELLARIRALARRRAEPEGARLVVGRLELDRLRREAWHADEPIPLAPTEFRLLELLMQHPNEVLTRHAIHAQIWGYDADNEAKMVDLYIHYLRKKLGQRVSIATVRGIGYRLEVADRV